MSKSGSQTSQTIVATTNNTETAEDSTIVITARAPERRPRVQFTADTVDNEGMGKKSSKGKNYYPDRTSRGIPVYLFFIVCCIYKKPKAFGESSSESDSSDDDVSPYERKPKAMKKKNKKCSHDHSHDHK